MKRKIPIRKPSNHPLIIYALEACVLTLTVLAGGYIWSIFT